MLHPSGPNNGVDDASRFYRSRGLLAVIAMAEPAAARDGCGQGAYWDGYRCAPMRMQRDYAPRYYQEDRRLYRRGGTWNGCPYGYRAGRCL